MATEFTPATVDRSGVTIPDDLAAVDATGNFWANTGRELFLVHNASGGNVTVTLNFGPGAIVDGVDPTDKTVVVGNGDGELIGPFPVLLYNDANGRMQITYSSGTSVTAKVVRVPQ